MGKLFHLLAIHFQLNPYLVKHLNSFLASISVHFELCPVDLKRVSTNQYWHFLYNLLCDSDSLTSQRVIIY